MQLLRNFSRVQTLKTVNNYHYLVVIALIKQKKTTELAQALVLNTAMYVAHFLCLHSNYPSRFENFITKLKNHVWIINEGENKENHSHDQHFK